jgi:uncharacterized protein YyaL (SSP411 family)
MAQNLLHLGIIMDRADWKEKALNMVSGFSQLIAGEPNYMSYWAIVYTEIKKGMAEVVLLGPASEDLRKNLQQAYQPFAIFMGTPEKSELPLIIGKSAIDNQTTIYVCYDKTCRLPVYTTKEALAQLM